MVNRKVGQMEQCRRNEWNHCPVAWGCSVLLGNTPDEGRVLKGGGT